MTDTEKVDYLATLLRVRESYSRIQNARVVKEWAYTPNTNTPVLNDAFAEEVEVTQFVDQVVQAADEKILQLIKEL